MAEVFLTTAELAEVFGYASVQSVHTAICKKTFPVPTYRVGKRRVADREVVKAFFRRYQQEGLRQLSESR